MSQVTIAASTQDLGADHAVGAVFLVRIAPELTPSQKLGQPVPDSNLVRELNKGASQQTQ